jgi:hypothetical protein
MELINNMKMCLLCLSSEEYPYTESAARLHNRDGLHHTVKKGYKHTWAPLKGNEAYESHISAKKLGLIDSL